MTRSREVSKGATRVEFVYTATAGQTSFSGNDGNSNSLAYTAGQIDVFLNGVRLAAADYTATNGTTVVLGVGAEAGDTLNINAFGTFSVADVIVDRLEFDYTATAGQTTFTGSDNDSQTMAYTAGRIDVYLNGSRLNQTDDYVATNGTSVVLQSGAQAGDSLVVVAHGTVNLASNILSGDLDLNGNELILDVDGDTTITADTDDQIDIKIAGADDFQFTANDFSVLSGSTLNIDSGGTIACAGTLSTGFVGKQTMWVPATAMNPTVSNGCSAITAVETTSGRPDLQVLDFDKDSDEFAQFSVAFPKAWNAGTVTFQVYWAGIAATSDVDWMVDAVAVSNNTTIDVAYGTAVVVTDNAQGAVEELNVSAESGAVTIAGSPGDDEVVFFRIGRDVSGDAMAGDARLLGVKIFFTTDALTDA
tara:strand:+ start:346 stop:1602 length:1257 start_codon:yes stop_codon:yes gene_type:complete